VIDISIVARKAIPDAYAPLELSNEGPPKLAGTALLSDSRNTFLGGFGSLVDQPRRTPRASLAPAGWCGHIRGEGSNSRFGPSQTDLLHTIATRF